MVMTNNEIVRDWAEAKNPAAQIAVLADLNAAKIDEIKKILRNDGKQIIASAYEQGYGLEKISKHYGFAPMTVRAMIIEAGGKIRDQKEGVAKFNSIKDAVQNCSEPTEEPTEIDLKQYNLDAYQLAKVLAQIIPELCSGFDVEFSQMGNKTKVMVYGDNESLTYIKCSESKEMTEEHDA